VFRVHTDEHRRDAPRISPKLVERGGHDLQGGGAYVGTIGVAKVQQEELAAKILIGDTPAGVVGKREGSTDQGLAHRSDINRWQQPLACRREQRECHQSTEPEAGEDIQCQSPSTRRHV
jgi:hypothetical protein